MDIDKAIVLTVFAIIAWLPYLVFCHIQNKFKK